MKPLGAGFAWLTAALAAMLCGCATPARGEARHSAIVAAGLGLAGAAAAPAAQGWWQGFDEAQLDRLIQRALSDNPGLAQASARLRQPEAQAVAAHAGQLPGVRLTGGETRLKIPEGFPLAIGGGQTVRLGDLGAVLAWDLDLWDGQADALAQTRALAEAANLDLDNAGLLPAGAPAVTGI